MNNEENKKINNTKKKTSSKSGTKTNTKKTTSKVNDSKATTKTTNKSKNSTTKMKTNSKTSSPKVEKIKENTSLENKNNLLKQDVKETTNEVIANKVEDNVIKENLEKEIEKQINKENIISLFEKIIVLVAVALVFSLIGYFIGSKDSKKNVDYEIATKDLQTFIEQYNNIIENYFGNIDKNSLIKGAIKGMLSTLDDYTDMIDDSSNNFNITLEGEYEGLGIEIINDTNGNIIIYNVYDNTPASKVGLKVNDIITKINETDLSGKTTTELVSLIAKSDNIKFTILRNNKEMNFELKKEKIVLDSVEYEMLENNIGYIYVSIFANNTYSQFKNAIESLENQNMTSLIIDLRDNTGGHLSTVKDMLGLFMDSSHVIYQTEDKNENVKFYSNGKSDKTYKIVILQNSNSASASEIMTSALKEQLNAYVIGTTSYGKGTVQQLETVSGIGQYKFTTKKWLTSKGTWIDKQGITPDLEVTLSDDYKTKPVRSNDNQLQEAIKYLEKK